ncbi:hypothetical protein [Clostridium tagluense]|uniref:DUF3990 domain-containing protein n=1 Tax=Clostridium tagluense TaxID=360422 RepID=A0A401USU2_9CLOT|nr:hypothetical protein [Clostridium tagluense]GCD12571.1 hypothetical protein Ctaglu_41940 [Clostridium tagluense]
MMLYHGSIKEIHTPAINLYIREYIPKEELLRRIKMQKRNQQVCIVNQEAIQRLRFIKGECV